MTRITNILLLLAPMLTSACSNTVEHKPPVAMSISASKAPSAAAAKYAALRARVLEWNGQWEPSAWWMNSEHLFIYDQALMQDAITYVRTPEGLEQLFRLVLSPTTSDEDLLVTSELLVYFGGHIVPGDPKIKNALATRVLEALADGRARSAERTYPEAPIAQKIRDAAEKALP
jgi:hypothetical protein